jgi:hypothetical protein
MNNPSANQVGQQVNQVDQGKQWWFILKDLLSFWWLAINSLLGAFMCLLLVFSSFDLSELYLERILIHKLFI